MTTVDQEALILERLDSLGDKLDRVDISIQEETASRKESIKTTKKFTNVFISIGLILILLFSGILYNFITGYGDDQVASCNRGNDSRTSINSLQEGVASLEEALNFTIHQVPANDEATQTILQQIFDKLDVAKTKIDSARLSLRDCSKV